jgi:carbonic anhydrase/acetyltransferase-like protein (isoleucine patch superfamily)
LAAALENAALLVPRSSEAQEIFMAIYELDGQGPDLPADGNYFIADTATVIGKVRLKAGASVWFGAVLRGDNEWIEIGEGSNVQDGSTCHTDLGFPLTIGKNCTVGHNAILHGCTIEDGALIGMGSIVLNGARISRNSIVGAGSVVTTGKQFPENSLIIGSPARLLRTLEPDQVKNIGRDAESYQRNGPRYRKGLKKIG